MNIILALDATSITGKKTTTMITSKPVKTRDTQGGLRLDEIDAQRTLINNTDTVTFLKEPLKGIRRRIFAIKLMAMKFGLIGVLVKYYAEKDKMLNIPNILKRYMLYPI